MYMFFTSRKSKGALSCDSPRHSIASTATACAPWSSSCSQRLAYSSAFSCRKCD